MSFGDHLEELRSRLIAALIVPLPAAVLLFMVSATMLEWLMRPLVQAMRARGMPAEVQELSPPEILLTRLKLSIIGAIIVSAPWIVYQLWLFVRPGLYTHERRFVRFLVPGSAVLTATGVTLMYTVLMPLMLMFMLGFGASLGGEPGLAGMSPAEQDRLGDIRITGRFAHPAEPAPGEVWFLWPRVDVLYEGVERPGGSVGVRPIHPPGLQVRQQYQVSRTVGFMLTLYLGTVLAFQLPLVMLLLGWLGLIERAWLAANRRYALFGCAVAAAIFTPPDPGSMVVMLVPIYGLYELGLLLMRVAPAGRVAEGPSIHWPWRPAEKSREGPDTTAPTSDQPGSPARPDGTVPRRPSRDESEDPSADESRPPEDSDDSRPGS